MLHFDIITLLPDIIMPTLQQGVVGRAHQKYFTTQFWNPRHYTHDAHHTVDDRPYGGGPGMIMQYAPLKATFDDICSQSCAHDRSSNRGKRIYLSPQGKLFNQQMAQAFSQETNIILLAGRYEGVDERFISTEIDEEVSIGDYILSGGELATAVFIDAVVRLLPNVLHHPESAIQDSFVQHLLDYPHYTRPEIINNLSVPSVLLSGNHQAIQKWRHEQALLRTQQRRPDLWLQYNNHLNANKVDK